MMLGSVPTPQRSLAPSPSAVSTYATAVASAAGAHGVLGVVDHVEVDAEAVAQAVRRRRRSGRCPRRVTVRCSPSTTSWAVMRCVCRRRSERSSWLSELDRAASAGRYSASERVPHRRRG